MLPDVYEFEDEDMGERHNKSALPWDEIPPVAITPLNSIGNIEQLEDLSKSRVKNNLTFKLIEENAAFVKSRKENTIVSLNEVKFRKDQEEVNSMSKRLEEIRKNAEKMEMANIGADMERINLDSASITKNKDWLNNLSKDIYIAETVNIINDISKQGMKLSGKTGMR
jgi:carboxyl-terminal processing protease